MKLTQNQDGDIVLHCEAELGPRLLKNVEGYNVLDVGISMEAYARVMEVSEIRRKRVTQLLQELDLLTGIKTKKLVYLACPYSHDDANVRYKRYEAVNKVAAILMLQGHTVFSPISHTHPIACAGDLPKGWEYWQEFDRIYLAHSKSMTVLCLEGWEDSKGVQGEIAIAYELGLPITYVNADGYEMQRATERGDQA